MLDTNVLISMVFFPSERFVSLINYITREHTLILSSFVIEELQAVADRKFAKKKSSVDRFLEKLSYEMVYTPHSMRGGMFEIRDIKDYPVLYTAIIENVDVLITGDKDFQEIDIEKPEILTPTEFISRYLL